MADLYSAFKTDDAEDATHISAYYSLVFPSKTFYLQTLSVLTIGRNPVRTDSTSSTDTSPRVDIDLKLKSVSRLHAKIEWDKDEDSFVLVVVGRNGAWVDGVWAGSGSRVILSERSQIQIASRTFHFVLPPAPTPEDSASPSSQSDEHRARSPSISIDVTTLSPPSTPPAHSPPRHLTPPPPLKIPPRPAAPELPSSHSIGKSKNPSKKRKKPDGEPISIRPEDMPPKPQFTYAQLCYRAIKSFGGKATLQDICQWMMENFDWYRYNEGTGWESSVRHNLSSSRAFKKMERCAGERGKGFFWSVDEGYEHTFEEQEAKAQGSSLRPDGKSKSSKKDKNAIPLEPALKRIAKDSKGSVLPPPLTSAPLMPRDKDSFISAPSPSYSSGQNAASLKTEGFYSVQSPPARPASNPWSAYHAGSMSPPAHTTTQASDTATAVTPRASSIMAVRPTISPPAPSSISLSTALMSPAAAGPSTTANPPTSAIHNLPEVLHLPIVIGPVPATHPMRTIPADDPLAEFLTTPPIVLDSNILILNPEVFAHLSPDQVKELEALGTRKALEILQGHIKRYLMERKKAKARAKAKKKKAKAAAAAAAAAANGQAPGAAPTQLSGVPSGNASSVNGVTGFRGSVSSKTPVPVPINGSAPPTVVNYDPGSPIVIIDDDDEEELQPQQPVTKRPRLDVPVH